jgi:ammonium transporter Rh
MRLLGTTFALALAACCPIWAADAAAPVAAAVRQVEQYNFSIHILAMLLVGFGFLMVFVRNYGYSATTGTYLVVAVGIPLYMLRRPIPSTSCCWPNSPAPRA